MTELLEEWPLIRECTIVFIASRELARLVIGAHAGCGQMSRIRL
jgi:hypothetical protein